MADIIFLGVAERAALVRDGGTNALKWNVLGLKHLLLTNFFPLRLSGWSWGFAFRNAANMQSIDLRLRRDTGEELGRIQFAMESDVPAEDPALLDNLPIMMPPEGWGLAFFKLDNLPIVIDRPSRCVVVLLRDGGIEEIVGEFQVLLVEPLPLSPERIAAIKADPHAAKALRANVGCTKCPSQLLVYAALERTSKHEEEGYIWYQDLPDEFVCGCGSTRLDVRTMKRNFFAPLGHPLGVDGDELRYEPRYEEGALNAIRLEFVRLLDAGVAEEVLQKFIERNPIILHQFPADKLFFKPAILTFFTADFALVTPQKELLLVEIEKPQTRLLTRNGGEAAELGHAFDQVHSWLHVIDEHRLAVLDSLKIDRNAVSLVRGVVIAGRDRGYDAQHLRRLKGVDRGRVSFLTYDDLAFGLAALQQRIRRL